MPAFTVTTPVRFADIDHAGIVYYPRFFHLFHLAFEELWRARMGSQAYAALIDRDRIGFPAVRAECSFEAPLRFGDLAEIELAISRMGTKSITFVYRVYRGASPGFAGARSNAEHCEESIDARPRTLCAQGQVVCAVVDLARFVAVAIPERVADMLRDLLEA
jgi:4-hydroxybenzoyl-CoA thioesterase